VQQCHVVGGGVIITVITIRLITLPKVPGASSRFDSLLLLHSAHWLNIQAWPGVIKA
jgi:hypothetical protein